MLCVVRLKGVATNFISFHFIAALKKHWGIVEFVAIIPIEHAGTTLSKFLVHLTVAFATVRIIVDQAHAIKSITLAITDYHAKSHDYRMFKTLLDSLLNLA